MPNAAGAINYLGGGSTGVLNARGLQAAQAQLNVQNAIELAQAQMTAIATSFTGSTATQATMAAIAQVAQSITTNLNQTIQFLGETSMTGVCITCDGTDASISWGNWNDNYTTTVAAHVWTQWVRVASSATVTANSIQYVRQSHVNPTPTQVESWQHQQIQAEKEKANARIRAEILLHESLDRKQREELAAKGYFEVVAHSKDGSRRTYRIRRGYQGNVTQVEGEKEVRRFCIHPVERVPDEDAMLAQKLYLESVEPEFLRVANQTILVPGLQRLQLPAATG